MTQEQKDLLLKDLCGRLPYGIKVNNEIQGDFKIYGICENFAFGRNEVCHIDFNIEKIKPYLFPLSSMTKEIMDEIYATTGVYDISIDSSVHIEVGTTFIDLTKIFDILHKHHIDYRGLIPKGLAIDATGLNIY